MDDPWQKVTLLHAISHVYVLNTLMKLSHSLFNFLFNSIGVE